MRDSYRRRIRRRVVVHWSVVFVGGGGVEAEAIRGLEERDKGKRDE